MSASAKQVGYIRSLWKERALNPDDNALEWYVLHKFSKQKVTELTKDEASATIKTFRGWICRKGFTAMSSDEYAKLSAAHKARAFSIAEQSNADLLEGVRKELQEAVENNMTFRQFLDGMDEVFDKYGVTKLSTRRAELVFRQNVQTAYAVGRHAQMTEPHIMRIRPYWQYVAVRDGRTRPSHRALDGLVFPATHEFWNTHYPPNGYQCRCTVKALSERQVRERGLEVLDSLPADLVDPRTGEIIEDASPDPGFDINPALAWAT